MNELLEDLRWRGLLHDTTDLDRLSEHLSQPRRVYAGFDPSRPSLTIGNLVPILLLRRFQAAGHTPVVVMGGGTGLIGDPSGKEAERQLMSEEQVARNVDAQRPVFETVLDFSGECAAELCNNLGWLSRLGFIEVLRDTGKHFAVNMMIQKESVKNRLHNREQGISYTEFSYMILQAYDFFWLHENHGVTVQVGGSDQWGNVVAGIDLIRRTGRREAHGLTVPLVTKSDGGKFGKTESGAIWLTRDYTTPYAFYQFWLNTPDADVERYLKYFTLLKRPEIEELVARHQQSPGERAAQRVLAEEVTRTLHGPDACAEAANAARALFSGDVADLPGSMLDEVFAHAPASAHEKVLLGSGGVAIVELLVLAQVAKSKREARQYVDQGAISVNGRRVDQNFSLTEKDLLNESVALIRRGKKTWHVTRWS